ncbi:hypothetical protein [Raineyella sp.]|uniref:hypothetical protein n=1 Tax=Raineyella sp. TaxID=1911550 RepID=UPI002B1F611B|nr:hypothetical protein [Raineyella sp.]MEA5153638.1 hypothetical protein [Raineyella sp.]
MATLVGVFVAVLHTHLGLGTLPAAALDGTIRGLFVGLVVGVTADRALRAPWAVLAGCIASLITGAVSARRVHLDTSVLLAGAFTVVTGIVVVWALTRLSRKVKTSTLGLGSLGVVLVSAIALAGWTPWRPSDEVAAKRFVDLASQPVPLHYAFDGWTYLRARDLMIQGQPFYSAITQALRDDSPAHRTIVESPFNIRQPLLFELWRILPGELPYHLLGWFIAFSLLAIAGAYLLARTFVEPGPALVAPILMTSWLYFFWWSSSYGEGPWFTMMEVWAGFVAIFALALLLRRRWLASLVLLWCAVATREFMVLLIPAWLVAWFVGQRPVGRRRTWWVPVGAVVVPVLVLLLHMWLASGFLERTPSSTLGLAHWLHGGPATLQRALQFGWYHVQFRTYVVPALSVLALAGALTLRQAWHRATLTVTLVLMLFFLFRFSHGEWAYYWGGIFTPIVVSLVPLVVSRWLPSRDRSGYPDPARRPDPDADRRYLRA